MFGMIPAYGLYARHAAGITLRDISLRSTNQENRPAVCLEDVQTARIQNLTAATVIGTEPVIRLKNVSSVSIYNSTAPRATRFFLHAEADHTSDVLVSNCDLSKTMNIHTPTSVTGAVDLHNNIAGKKVASASA